MPGKTIETQLSTPAERRIDIADDMSSDVWVCAVCGAVRVNPYGAPTGDRPPTCGECGDLLASVARPFAPMTAGLALL